MCICHAAGLALAAALVLAAPVAAQDGPPEGGLYVQPHARPAPAAEFFAGHAGFADDATIEHSVFGGAARFYLTPRIAIGPELTYMRGPDDDRDLFLLANLTFDILSPRPSEVVGGAARPRRVSPFLVAGGGFSRFSDRIGPLPFSSGEGAFAAGGGTRVWFGDRAYASVDFRIGWELHYRVTGGVGFALR